MLIIKKLLTQAASYKSCASAAKLLGGGPILETGFQDHGLLRVTATSDHHRTLSNVLLVSLRELVFSKSSPSRRSQYDASRNLASGHQAPQGN